MKDDLWPEGGFFDKISDLRDEQGPIDLPTLGGSTALPMRQFEMEDRYRKAKFVHKERITQGWDDLLELDLAEIMVERDDNARKDLLVKLASHCAAWYTAIENKENNG